MGGGNQWRRCGNCSCAQASTYQGRCGNKQTVQVASREIQQVRRILCRIPKHSRFLRGSDTGTLRGLSLVPPCLLSQMVLIQRVADEDLRQLLFDPGANTVAEKDAVGDDHAAAAAFGAADGAAKLPHDELQE